ncbi:MAG: T9SS type A sorting domain-containing protein [Bacteroidales bacterium]
MKYLFVILLFAFGLSASGQVKQEVIAAAGGYNRTADRTLSISWTLGEIIVPNFRSVDRTIGLSTGFQQRLILTEVQEEIEVEVKVTVDPNPTSDMIKISFNSEVDKEVLLFLLDEQGRMILTDKIEPAVPDKTINLQNYAAGVYYLRMIKGKQINVYKVVKLF